MIAAMAGRSSAAKAYESALSGLDDGPVEPRPREVELGDGLAVHPDPARGDQAPGFAGRADPQMFGQQSGQVEWVAGRQRGFGHLLGRLVLPHDAREVLLPMPGAVVTVPPRDDAAGQLELPLHRILRM